MMMMMHVSSFGLRAPPADAHDSNSSIFLFNIPPFSLISQIGTNQDSVRHLHPRKPDHEI